MRWPLTIGLLILATAPAAGWTPEELWGRWPEERFVATAAPCLRHAELIEKLEELESRHEGELEIEEMGRSFEDRSIRMVRLGRGDDKVLLWSQMHGDEPSATPALLDAADFLLRGASEGDPEAARVLDRLTLLMVPMLNPDGTEVYSRRNAQFIDVNRDALNLATPEGRILKRLRREHEPVLGFNLHDQNRRTAVGDTGKLATNAVLAVAGDPEGTVTAGRERAKRACSAIVAALDPLMPGGMARYNEDWSPRAFGDNLTAWGTPVVLLESGGVPPGRSLTELTRLNFVALLTVLADLARDDLAGHDPRLYEDLPRNKSNAWADLVVRGGEVLRSGTDRPYRADLAFHLIRPDVLAAGCVGSKKKFTRTTLVELGDARFVGAGRFVDAEGLVATPPLTVRVTGWRQRRWLGTETLADVARWGVGKVQWVVKRRHLERARRVASDWAAASRPVIEVAAVGVPGEGLELDTRPPAPASDSMMDILRALGGGIEPPRAQDLWPATRNAMIRRGAPASFLLITRPPGDRLDLERSRLMAVWLDGEELAPPQTAAAGDGR